MEIRDVWPIASLYWHSYSYFPYEKELALREVSSLLKPSSLNKFESGLKVGGDVRESLLRRLVYFGEYRLNGEKRQTLQAGLESSCGITGKQRRQSTRYSVHGLHEYKGKFNPQIVRGILNILGIGPQTKVLDPFCGSGTTLVECSHGDINAVGCDLNPLAVFISNAKLQALTVSAQTLQKCFENIQKEFERALSRSLAVKDDDRSRYLRSWFEEKILIQIENLKHVVDAVAGDYRNIFLALASDLLRSYSLQEPEDLRIRRRRTPYPEQSLGAALKQKIISFLNNVAAVQEVVGIKNESNCAYLYDSRELGSRPRQWKYHPLYHAAITSPPYATALPYIDTQRLSLVWLNLCNPKDLVRIEADLTGSREFSKGQKKSWEDILARNLNGLPPNIYDFYTSIERAVSENDGFRRRAVPYLLYRYLSDMQEVFNNVFRVLRKKAPFALVVGHNQTTLGGRKFLINTPELLKEIAVNCGWLHEESLPLQTYQRYGLHMNNAVKTETLLILRKP